jgi:cytochrome c553
MSTTNTMSKWLLSTIIGVALQVDVSPALADMLDTSSMAAWETCALCHSADGISPMSKFPKLAGQKAAYIEKQVLDFRHDKRSNDGGQMQTIAAEVEVSSLHDSAQYFASLPPPPVIQWDTENKEQTKLYGLGKQLFEKGRKGLPACASCHADRKNVAPWIDAQHPQYLQKQLQDFKRRDRNNDAAQQMQRVVDVLRMDEIEALVFYLAGTQLVRE